MFNNQFTTLSNKNLMTKNLATKISIIIGLLLWVGFSVINILSTNHTVAKQESPIIPQTTEIDYTIPTIQDTAWGDIVQINLTKAWSGEFSTTDLLREFPLSEGLDEDKIPLSPKQVDENIVENTATTEDTESKANSDQRAILKKLEEFNRMQIAITTLEELDKMEGTTWEFLSPQEASAKATSIWKEVSNVISEIQQLQEEQKKNDHRYEIILQQIQKVIIDIKVTQNTVNDSALRINLYTKEMLDTIADLQKTREHIDNTKKTLWQLLPVVYMLQNEYANEEGNIDDLKLLMWSGSISENLSQEEMLAGISIKLDTLLVDLGNAQNKYIANYKTLNTKRKQLKDSIISYQEKLKTLEEQKEYLLYFIDVYKNNKVQLDATITDLFATREQIQQKTDFLIQNLSKKQQQYAITVGSWDKTLKTWFAIWTSGYKEFLKLSDHREDNRVNFFGWPTLPITQISTFFDSEVTVGGKKEISKGIQAKANQWEEIYAPANGYVYFIQDQDWLGINMIMLLHNEWYITLFSNVQKVIVKEGDVVKRWQIIGLIWGQPGTRGAWWFSTESALSMQIYKNGAAIDPLETLDLSIFNNEMLLPIKYRQKYSTDTKIRNSVMTFSDITYVNGNTATEKRENFLTQYAKAPYHELSLWETAAKGTNIDPDLGICIGYAETSLGRAFASANNIGNVGNNDRGDRVDKESPLVWARAIYETLNNGYLGGYQTIYELSGYGNKDWAIYASSEYNWQKNVSRCLSTIKWYTVPEDYPFRTYNPNN